MVIDINIPSFDWKNNEYIEANVYDIQDKFGDDKLVKSTSISLDYCMNHMFSKGYKDFIGGFK